MSCMWSSSYNSWRWTILPSQVYDTIDIKILLVSQSIEPIPVTVKLKQVVMPHIELIQDKNTTNILPSRFKGYADINPNLLSEHDHQIILDNIKTKENMNHDEYLEDKNYYNVDSDDN